MRALVIDQLGGSDNLRIADLPTPAPGAGEVLIEVGHAGVNPADWKTREGWLASFITYQFPFTLGYDMGGTVVALGDEVAGIAVGDRVAAYSQQMMGRGGSHAEYALADAARVAVLPSSVGLAQAAALPVPGVTAWEAVFVSGRVEAGQKVLVNGGSGGLGSYAIQLARHAGAAVATTCSKANHDYVLDLGAEVAIDYRLDSVHDAVLDWAPDGVDLVIDAVGQGSLLDAAELTRAGGCVAPIGTLDVSEPQHDAKAALERDVRVVPTMSNNARSGGQLRSLVALLASGELRSPEIRVVPLDDAVRAYDEVQTGHVRGKVVLEVRRDVTGG